MWWVGYMEVHGGKLWEMHVYEYEQVHIMGRSEGMNVYMCIDEGA